MDGNGRDLGGDVILKDGSVLRNRGFVKNTASMVHTKTKPSKMHPEHL